MTLKSCNWPSRRSPRLPATPVTTTVLLLADICIQTNRMKLARSILEELNELVDKHNLTSWETSDLIGAVWARLVRCYRDRNSGTANSDKAAEVYLKLSRLDPWQALALGDAPPEEH